MAVEPRTTWLVPAVHALAAIVVVICMAGTAPAPLDDAPSARHGAHSKDGTDGNQEGHGGHSGHAGHGRDAKGAKDARDPKDAGDAERAGAADGDSKAKDPLRDAGVAPEARRAAIASGAKSNGRDELRELLAVVESCGACPAAKDLGSILAAWDVETLAKPEIMAELVEIAASEKPEALRVAAARAINAVPESKRSEGAKRFAAQRVEIVCVPGVMKWDPKEFSVPAGTLLELVMRNDDSMQHNLLVVAPGSLSEIGVAADRIGETAEGKAREYVPDSPKVLHVMGMVEPGATGTLWLFAPAKPATYPLVCTYPGHWRMMNGRMKVTKPVSDGPTR